MEEKNLELVMELIDEIANSYDQPTDEQVSKMIELTGREWDAEDMGMYCFEYESRASIEETAYVMFNGTYPTKNDKELVFFKFKQGAVMDKMKVYESYRFGKGGVKAVFALPFAEIEHKIVELLPNFEKATKYSSDTSIRFECLEQAEYWSDTHFWLFAYSKKKDATGDIDLIRILCHNMNEEQTSSLLKCMESFEIPLQIEE